LSFAAIRDRVALDAFRGAPAGVFSGIVGWSARRRLPRALRGPLYRAFARVVGADLTEAERPVEDYPSLGAFFARRLGDGLRPLPDDPRALISPCDGRLAARGAIEAGTLLQVKGLTYSLAELLGDGERAARYEGGHYATIYLSPRDYHRVHTPLAAALTGYDYLPGALFPVMPYFAERVEGLLCRNERVVLHLEAGGRHAEVVMVAAVGVGNMALARPAVESRQFRAAAAPRRERFAGIPLALGDELGTFELGSTVVVVFEPGHVALEPLPLGAAVRLGMPFGRVEGRGRA
jgi:phosphatidylserine decarboxylase